MALTFPRTLPDTRTGRFRFELDRVDYSTTERRGASLGVQVGFPLWKLSVNFGAGLTENQADAWVAWADSLQGGSRTFYGCEPTRARPKTYLSGFSLMTRAGGGAFPDTGAATSWSVDTTREVLTLNGLPAGFILQVRDYVGFEWTSAGGDPRRALVRTLEAATANGSGVLTVTISPPLPTVVDAGATARVSGGVCIMRLLPSETTIGDRDELRRVGGTITAIQDLRA
jgi:hypothetical protein